MKPYEAKCITILTATCSKDVAEGATTVEKTLNIMAKFHYINLKGEETTTVCDLGTYLTMQISLETAKVVSVEQVTSLEDINSTINEKVEAHLNKLKEEDFAQAKLDKFKRTLRGFEFDYPNEQGSGRYMDSIQVTTLDGAGTGGAYLEYIN